MRSFLPSLLVPALALSLSSCGENGANVKVAEASDARLPYRLEQPLRSWSLPDDLLEVSGVSWLDRERVLVIEDRKPQVYVLRLGKQVTVERTIPVQPAGKGQFDLEDVVQAGNVTYTLRSDGTLFATTGDGNTRSWSTGLRAKDDTEGLGFDPVSGYLLVAPKAGGGKKGNRPVWAFDIKSGRLLPEPFFTIDSDELKQGAGGKGGFFPSAIAVHPLSGEFYVLSAKGGPGLARFDRKGTLLSYTPIAGDRLPQPEGLTFAPDGTLYLSSEGTQDQAARLMEFRLEK